jgi:hypothetical protein
MDITSAAILTAIPVYITAAAAAAAVLPQGTPGSWWYIVRTILIDLPALNVGNAANAKKH